MADSSWQTPSACTPSCRLMLPSFAEEAPIWNLDRPALLTSYYVPLMGEILFPSWAAQDPRHTILFRSTLWTSRAFLLTLSSERNEQSKPSQHLADSRPARARLS